MFPKTGIFRLALITALSVAATPVMAQVQMDSDTPPAPPGVSTSPMGNMNTGQNANGAPGALPMGQAGAQQSYSLTPEEAAELEQRLKEEAEEKERKQREESFDQAVGTVLPLKPDEIREMLEYFRESREAAETPIVEPEAQIKIETVSLDPGTPPSTIKTAPGHVTTLNILDVTGQPWPIRDVSWAGQFNVTPPDEGGHVLRITPLSAHGSGNISIQLVDLITPITFSLKTGLDISHYRFDARIPEMGPLANVPLIDQGGLEAVAGNKQMINFLEGLPPADATQLEVTGVDGRTRVWEFGSQYYLRTPLVLLSPAWSNSLKSSDGMNVYTLNEAPVILLSDKGRMVEARIESQEE